MLRKQGLCKEAKDRGQDSAEEAQERTCPAAFALPVRSPVYGIYDCS